MDIVIGFTLVFLAGFLNNYSGGGKFVQLPAIFLFSPGMAIPEIVGINKLVSLPTALVNLKNIKQKTFVSIIKFIPVLISGMIISFLATYLFLSLNKNIQEVLFVFFISLGFVLSLIFKSEIKEKINAKFPFLAGYFLCSIYEGFLGAGNGSIIVYLLKKYRAKSTQDALAISRVLTLGLMLGSLVVFIKYTQIEWVLALPLAGMVLVGDAIGKMTKSYLPNPIAVNRITTGLGFISCLLSGYLVFA